MTLKIERTWTCDGCGRASAHSKEFVRIDFGPNDLGITDSHYCDDCWFVMLDAIKSKRGERR